MNVLLLGSGGREHAMAWAIAKSSLCDTLYVAPGNGGTSAVAVNVPDLKPTDAQAVLAFAREHQVQLVVIGPEAPLVAGVADVLRQAGVDVFGPDAQGAQLEGSKDFSKRFMIAHGIPTAEYGCFTNQADAVAYIKEKGAPIVVKADGLAAGKGVVVAQDQEEAIEAVHHCFSGAFGEAGQTVVIEECLEGPECSLLTFVTGGKAFCMSTAQDHKRAFDGDLGPNTGGMGVYSPVPMVKTKELTAMSDIMRQAAAATGAKAQGGSFDNDYRGVLYGGFMLTPQGPKVLEFNARFGDPETQVILPRLAVDVLEVMLAVAQGRPQDIHLEWTDKWAVGVVLASQGYPGSYKTGRVILGLDEVAELEDVLVFHAGTAINEDGELVTAGGRVLNVVGLGKTFQEARELAYRACALINFEGKQMRQDIGRQAAEFLEGE